MKLVEFHPEAADEARAAASYYAEIKSELGGEFQGELDAALKRIQDNPLMYAMESDRIRICPLHRFPYALYYEDFPDQIWIAAIGHHARRPGYWQRRREN